MDLAAGIVDVGQHQDRHAPVERTLHLGALDDAQRMIAAEQIDQPLRDIEVGREIGGFGQDEVPPWLDA